MDPLINTDLKSLDARDYFAAVALNALVVSSNYYHFTSEVEMHNIASNAYAFADHMLAIRTNDPAVRVERMPRTLYLVWCNDDLLAILPEHKGQEAVDFLEKQKVRHGGGFTRTPYRDDDPFVQRWSNGGSVPRLSIEKQETK